MSIPKSRTTEGRRAWRVKNQKRCLSYTTKWRAKNRFASALIASRAVAKRLSYAPCDATVVTLAQSFTGECHICGDKEGSRRLHLDHDHISGAFRGWLCNRCNLALGTVQDSVDRLVRLIDYLKKGST